MSVAFLNNEFLPLDEAKISPLDRGFLFGDGIYEVVPSYAGKLLGFNAHIDRMIDGLKSIKLNLNWQHDKWRNVCKELCELNGNGNLGLYLQVSRGADNKRYHAFPQNVDPTVFCFAFEIGASPSADKSSAKTISVSTTEDLRWQRCHIKSTALLGNVLHFQNGYENGDDETILLNSKGEVIGINTLIRSGPGAGLSFAIPINKAKEVAYQLLENGKVIHPMIGISLIDESNFKKNKNDVKVGYVVPNSPAKKSGILINDIIIKVGNKDIKKSSDVISQISKKGNNKPIKILLKRGSKFINLNVIPTDITNLQNK